MSLAHLNWFDYALLFVILVSAIIGMIRGLVREILSLLTWVLAFVVGFLFADQVAVWLSPYITSQPVAQVTSFFILFVLVLIIGAIVNYIIGRIVAFSGFTLTDAFFGLIFGGLRGLLIALFVVFIVSNTQFQAQKWYNDSRMTYWLHDASMMISNHVIHLSKKLMDHKLIKSLKSQFTHR